jgi:hypothetical protein
LRAQIYLYFRISVASLSFGLHQLNILRQHLFALPLCRNSFSSNSLKIVRNRNPKLMQMLRAIKQIILLPIKSLASSESTQFRLSAMAWYISNNVKHSFMISSLCSS